MYNYFVILYKYTVIFMPPRSLCTLHLNPSLPPDPTQSTFPLPSLPLSCSIQISPRALSFIPPSLSPPLPLSFAPSVLSESHIMNLPMSRR